MQLRYSTCLGREIIEDTTGEVVGFVSGALVHPDKGDILGFYVKKPGFGGSDGWYLSGLDMVRIGTQVHIQNAEAIGDPSEIVRLQTILEDPRRFLGQKIRTEAGRLVGRCADLQFDADTLHITWLFPRRWWRWKMAVPIQEVVEVTQRAIVIRDEEATLREPIEEAEPVFPAPAVPKAGG